MQGGGTQRESGEVMIVLWKNDQRTHTPVRPKQSYPERGGKAWGGVGWGVWGKEKKDSLVRKLQAQI